MSECPLCYIIPSVKHLLKWSQKWPNKSVEYFVFWCIYRILSTWEGPRINKANLRQQQWFNKKLKKNIHVWCKNEWRQCGLNEHLGTLLQIVNKIQNWKDKTLWIEKKLPSLKILLNKDWKVAYIDYKIKIKEKTNRKKGYY